jgi:hypothetical protein
VDVTGAMVYPDFLVETGERVDLTGATVCPDFLVETGDPQYPGYKTLT